MPARFRLYLAVSLDGFIADAGGGVDWLNEFTDDCGFEGFYEQIETIITGRTTYDQAVSFDTWPFGNKTMYVATSRPIPEPKDGVVPWHGSIESLVREAHERTTSGDVWILGGAKLAEVLFALDAVDTLELHVIPVLLGDGIPLYQRNSRRTAWRLVSTKTYDQGIVGLVYEIKRDNPVTSVSPPS